MKKSIIILQDLSCFTKASINISLPVLEAMGADSAVLPLTLLSTQSDGFDNIYVRDLAGCCREVLDKFSQNGFAFDAFLSGYLSTPDQYEVAYSAMKLLREGALRIIDPVLGDDGNLYPGFTTSHVDMMRKYIRRASVITPNYTEACMLTGKTRVDDILSEFSHLTPASVVITSLPTEDGKVATLVSSDGVVRIEAQRDLGASVPGSGDLFSAVLSGRLLHGSDVFSAAFDAARITTDAIRHTLSTGRIRRAGIDIVTAIRGVV